MTLIDQRILIPASMQAVWPTIADHRLLSKWRIDVASVSVLTTEPSRAGTRRRIARKGGGRDMIEEMVVWYEGIGYEYHFIEGSDYRTFHARLRLQSAADGTIVQWVISYELGSIVKRILGGRRRKKQLEQLTVNSLRQLRRYIESTGARLDDQYRLKNSMQAAPDAQARAQYGAKLIAQESSRQIATIQAEQVTSATGPRIIEPPVRLEDTPSVPQVMPPSFLKEALQTSELKLASGVKPVLAEGPHQDTRPTPAIEDAPSTPASTTDTLPKPPGLISEPPVASDSTQPRLAVMDSQPVASTVDKSAAIPRQLLEMKPLTVEVDDDTNDVAPIKEDLPSSTAKQDTGEVSIWDVFGLRRPSDELSKIITELEQGDTPSSELKAPVIEEVTNTTPVPLEIETMPESSEPASSLSPLSDQPDAASMTADPSDGLSSAPAADEKKPKHTLEDWLAADEPPLPESSTGSMKNIVRIEQKPKIGLRRIQRQREEAVRRRNRQDRDVSNPDEE